MICLSAVTELLETKNKFLDFQDRLEDATCLQIKLIQGNVLHWEQKKGIYGHATNLLSFEFLGFQERIGLIFTWREGGERV